MRTIVAITATLSMIFVGLLAISEQAQEFSPDANTSDATNSTYDLSRDLFEGVFNVGGEGMVWFGVGAIVIVAMGLLVAAGSGGR